MSDETESLEAIQRSMPDKFDRMLNAILDRGGIRVQSTNADGQPIVEIIDIPAAMAGVIRNRIRDLKVGGLMTKDSPQQTLVEKAAMRFKGRPIPPIDTESDDAATA